MDAVRSWWSWLFDFSAGREEDWRFAHILTGILQAALAESETDAGFEQCFRQLIKASSGLEEECTWAWLSSRLSDYRRPGEYASIPRLLAERFLSDIPRRYGVKQTRE